jgi:hypothetical protein
MTSMAKPARSVSDADSKCAIGLSRRPRDSNRVHSKPLTRSESIGSSPVDLIVSIEQVDFQIPLSSLLSVRHMPLPYILLLSSTLAILYARLNPVRDTPTRALLHMPQFWIKCISQGIP